MGGCKKKSKGFRSFVSKLQEFIILKAFKVTKNQQASFWMDCACPLEVIHMLKKHIQRMITLMLGCTAWTLKVRELDSKAIYFPSAALWPSDVKLHRLTAYKREERIFLRIISQCKGVHRCQVLQLDGEKGEEEGGREAGRRGRG